MAQPPCNDRVLEVPHSVWLVSREVRESCPRTPAAVNAESGTVRTGDRFTTIREVAKSGYQNSGNPIEKVSQNSDEPCPVEGSTEFCEPFAALILLVGIQTNKTPNA